MADLSHIHRKVGAVTELDEVHYGRTDRVSAIAVTGPHKLVIIGPVLERLEVAVPLRCTKHYDMVCIDLSYRCCNPLVKRLKKVIQILDIIKIWSDRLVDKVIGQNHRLVLIVLGNLLPYVAEELLRCFAFKQPRIAVAVVDVVSGLSSWGVVHIENDIEAVLAAPADGIVKPLEAVLSGSQSHIVLVCEELVVERNTDGVGSCRSDELNVLFSHIIVLEHLPELCSKVRAYHFTEHLVNQSCGICLLEAEHIALRIKPVAEICSLDEELGSVRSHKVLSVDPDEIRRRYSSAGVATTEHKTCNECKQSQS